MSYFEAFNEMGAGVHFQDGSANGNVTTSFNLYSDFDGTDYTKDAPEPADSDNPDTAFYSLIPPDSGFPPFGTSVSFDYYYPDEPDEASIVISDVSFYNDDNELTLLTFTDSGLVIDTATLLNEKVITVFGLTAGNDTFILNDFGDYVHAGPGSDHVSGFGGNDTLFGDAGNDTLAGGANNDLLIGGRGKDTMSGQAGQDKFRFDATLDSVVGANRDAIADLIRAQHDKIDLHVVDADTVHAGNQAFVFIGTDTFAHYHSLHLNVFGMVGYTGHEIQANVNANMNADMQIHVNNLAAFIGGDFVL